MRNQSGLPIFQKYLAWAQRFFFQQAAGTLPDPHLVLNIDYDWPLDNLLVQPANLAMVAGNANTLIYAPTKEQHGIVYSAMVAPTVAALVATDILYLSLQPSVGGTGTRPWQYQGGTAAVNQVIPMIGGVYNCNAVTHPNLQLIAPPPIYVGPGERLRFDADSVAGGSTLVIRAWVLDRPSYYPLRLP